VLTRRHFEDESISTACYVAVSCRQTVTGTGTLSTRLLSAMRWDLSGIGVVLIARSGVTTQREPWHNAHVRPRLVTNILYSGLVISNVVNNHFHDVIQLPIFFFISWETELTRLTEECRFNLAILSRVCFLLYRYRNLSLFCSFCISLYFNVCVGCLLQVIDVKTYCRATSFLFTERFVRF